MPSDISINLKCPTYLIKYMEKTYGQQPIVLPKKCNWSLYLNENLRKAPEDYKLTDFGKNNLAIRLPFFEDKNVAYNWYLSELKQRILVDLLDSSFKVLFRSEVDKARSLKFEKKKIAIKDAIYSFMEDFNLEEDTFDMLSKDYQRYRISLCMFRIRNAQKLKKEQVENV